MDWNAIDHLGPEPVRVEGPVAEPFGVVDAGSAVPMLEFRGNNGTAFALPYRQLESLAFDAVREIVLQFDEHRIEVTGRNLRPLFDRLLRQEVTFIGESDLDYRSESATFVDRIKARHKQDLE